MKFYKVIDILNIGISKRDYPYIEFYLDNWDDFGYITTFYLFYFDETGKKFELGSVKILNSKTPQTLLKDNFEKLEENFCSLGQSMSYYRILSKFPEETSRQILEGLRDIVYLKSDYKKFPDQIGLRNSLLRSSEANKALKSAYDKYFLNIIVEEEVFNFNFLFTLPYSNHENNINFNFEDNDFLPNRINVLVGKNGAGKTQLLSKFADALCGYSEEKRNLFVENKVPLFSKVIAVSFSAFDDFRKPAIEDTEELQIKNDNNHFLNNKDSDISSDLLRLEKRKSNNYIYCGLQTGLGKTLSLSELKQNGISNLKKIIKRKEEHEENIDFLKKWKEILLNTEIPSKYLEDPLNIFNNNLSSGQSILVSIITEIIANIEEESILLFDEPELHLHPNATSNLVRMLYRLLEEFNSYAIISTHSPLIIQEIPSNCINKMIRTEDDILFVNKLSIETFGENISEIIDEVFNVREVESNYKTILKKEVDKKKSFEEICSAFPKGLSMHALTYLIILFDRKNGGER